MHFLNKIHPHQGKKNGLTVAEFLVVGGIILALSTIFMVWLVMSVQSFQADNRDSEREIHMKQFLQALTVYQSNQGNYPYPALGEIINGKDDILSKSLVESRLLIKSPIDPSNRGTYRYKYTSSNGVDFMLEYYLETDTISGKRKGLNKIFP